MRSQHPVLVVTAGQGSNGLFKLTAETGGKEPVVQRPRLE